MTQDNMHQEEFVRLLAHVPDRSWEKIIVSEPEWREMVDFLPIYTFGPFATLMVVAGLNDFQLKGKADRAYWPPIRARLVGEEVSVSPAKLADLLQPFYERERYNEMKVSRLHKFLKSDLAARLWQGEPRQVAGEFVNIWQRLAAVMNQGMEKKTIVFAMKCLGLVLIMAGEYDFPSQKLAIPVDLRVRRLTEALGGPTGSDDSVRAYWDAVLTGVRATNPHVTMIHLDSFVWQVADNVSEHAVRAYCHEMEMGEAGDAIATLIGGGPNGR